MADIKDRPLISVIIPVYNGEAFLAEAVESILRQDHRPLEIIVVDDGSTDNTPEVAKSFRDDVRYIFQENRGVAAARNTGLKAARGEFMAFLDADDVWTDDKLEVQFSLLIKNPSVEIVLGKTQRMQKTDKANGIDQYEEFSGPVLSLRLVDSLIRRSAFDKVGLLDESFVHCEDMDWFMRARELGVSMQIHGEVTSQYRRHEHNLTNQMEEGNRYSLMMLKRSLDRRRKRLGGEAESLPRMSTFEAVSDETTPGRQVKK